MRSEKQGKHVRRLHPWRKPWHPAVQGNGKVRDQRVGQGGFTQHAGALHVHDQSKQPSQTNTHFARLPDVPEDNDQRQHIRHRKTSGQGQYINDKSEQQRNGNEGGADRTKNCLT